MPDAGVLEWRLAQAELDSLNRNFWRRHNLTLSPEVAPSDALVLEGTDTPLRLYPGLVLQGATPAKSRGVCNGVLYEVVSVGETVTLKDDLGEYVVPLDFVAKT